MCIGPSSQFVPRKIIEISITNLWSFETSRAIFSDHWKFKLEKNTQACIIAGRQLLSKQPRVPYSFHYDLLSQRSY
jgi:hypothetical protein